ncbi:hypothetical protein [Ligilactobacillus salivarius]|uniref:hypothetical protein n=1 Tax=Ligilactobacillus salivarius TaxID=1624 RepID=UPI003D055537
MIYTNNLFDTNHEIDIDKLLKIGKYRSTYTINNSSTYFIFNLKITPSKYKSIIFDKNQGVVLSKFSTTTLLNKTNGICFTKLITEIIKKHHKFQAYTSAISDSHCFIRSSQHPATWINLYLVESIWDTNHHDISFKFKDLSGYVTFLNQKTSFRTSLKATAHFLHTVENMLNFDAQKTISMISDYIDIGTLKDIPRDIYTKEMLYQLIKEIFVFLCDDIDSMNTDEILEECHKYLVNKFCYFNRT